MAVLPRPLTRVVSSCIFGIMVNSNFTHPFDLSGPIVLLIVVFRHFMTILIQVNISFLPPNRGTAFPVYSCRLLVLNIKKLRTFDTDRLIAVDDRLLLTRQK